MSIILICGAECGIESIQAHVIEEAGSAMSFSTSKVRSGARSIRVAPNSGTSRIQFASSGDRDLWVGRLYILFEEFPEASEYLIYSGLSGNVSPITEIMGIAFRNSTNTIHCAANLVGGGLPYSFDFAGTGFEPELDVWYRIDFEIDRANGTVNGQITKDDGEENIVTLTESSGWTADPVDDAFRIGAWINPAGGAGVWYYDDILLSDDSAEYPLGPGYVQAFVPTSDGSHNITILGSVKRGNTGTDITNATTTAYQLVDDLPLPTASDDVDSIRITEEEA